MAPRSPVVLRRSSSDRRRSRSTSYVPVLPHGDGHLDTVKGSAQDRLMWIYLVSAVIAYVIIFFVVSDNYVGVNAWARVPALLANPLILSVFAILAFGLAAVATYAGHRAHEVRLPGTPWIATLAGLFIVIALLYVVIAWLVYRSHDYGAAFWLSAVAFVLVLVHTFGVWVATPYVAFAVIPLLAFATVIVYLLWFMADEVNDAGVSCCKTVTIEKTNGTVTV